MVKLQILQKKKKNYYNKVNILNNYTPLSVSFLRPKTYMLGYLINLSWVWVRVWIVVCPCMFPPLTQWLPQIGTSSTRLREKKWVQIKLMDGWMGCSKGCLFRTEAFGDKMLLAFPKGFQKCSKHLKGFSLSSGELQGPRSHIAVIKTTSTCLFQYKNKFQFSLRNPSVRSETTSGGFNDKLTRYEQIVISLRTYQDTLWLKLDINLHAVHNVTPSIDWQLWLCHMCYYFSLILSENLGIFLPIIAAQWDSGLRYQPSSFILVAFKLTISSSPVGKKKKTLQT